MSDCYNDCEDQLPQCPPSCNCTTNDIPYNGATDPCTQVTYLDKLTTVLTKLATFAKNRLFGIVPSTTIAVTDLTQAGCDRVLRADVKVSLDANNTLAVHSDGLYVPQAAAPEEYVPDYKVKVDVGGTPDFLGVKIVGGTDGIVTNTVTTASDKVVVGPSINVSALLDLIKTTYKDKFCEIVALCDSGSPNIWVADTYECQSSDLDLIVQKTINSLPEPSYSFVDGSRLYFVSQDNNIGVVYSIDPNTATTAGDIVYLNETRNGTPYGASGGTYNAGSPYKANASVGSAKRSVLSPYYDKGTRTLYIHSSLSHGCDYYNFATSTWGKINIGSTGSAYNNTESSDPYTHINIRSASYSNYLITGWGTGPTDRGARIIVIDKTTKTIIKEIITSVGTTFTGITGNPFRGQWGANITSDGRIFVSSDNNSNYPNIAVFNVITLAPIIEIVPAHTNPGFDYSSAYWSSSLLDDSNKKFYFNDYVGRTIDIYNSDTYALITTIHLDNNREFPTAQSYMTINLVTNELFMDVVYGGLSASGVDDASQGTKVSYRVDRSTLAINKIYIGLTKSTNLLELPNGTFNTTTRGNNNLDTPTYLGVSTFYIPNPSPLRNGHVDILTLKEETSVGNPTGVTKANTVGDPNYIAPSINLTLCPVTYALTPPSSIVATANSGESRYYVEFGLDDNVVLNPSLASIQVSVKDETTSTILATKTWTLPHVVGNNAFSDNGSAVGMTTGDTISISLVYLDSSATPLATFTSITSLSAV